MRHIIILFTAILFVGCSVMTSDFSEMRRTIQKPEIVIENPKIEEESKTVENNSKVEEQENIVEENNKDLTVEISEESEQQEVLDNQQKTDIYSTIENLEEKIEIKKIETEPQEDSIVEEKVIEKETTEIKEVIIEEILVENDNLKISKTNNTYKIMNEDTTIDFTKEDVINNDRFIWVIPYQSCVYELNGKLFFLDYSNFSEMSLEK